MTDQNQNNLKQTNEATKKNKSTDAKDLQKAISSAEALAKSMPTDDTLTKEARILLKEAIEKLVLANKTALEIEKIKISKIQSGESKNDNMVLKFTRPYRLSPGKSYEVWLDALKTELTSYRLLFLIDSSVPESPGLSEEDIILKKNSVKDVIISHIDEKYHLKIVGETEPKQILNKLRLARKGEIIATPTYIKGKLCNLKMKENEKVADFCERFDNIISEHEFIEDTKKIDDEEKA